MIEAMGGRKFLLAMICIAVGTAVQILAPAGVNESFVALLVGISGAFGVTNAFVSAKAIGAEATAPSAPVAPAAEPVDLSPLQADLNAARNDIGNLESAIRVQSEALGNLQQGSVLTNNLLKAALTPR